LAEHEGIVLGPYKDSVGVWTVYVGHTAGAGLPNPEKMRREDTRGWSEARARTEILNALALFDRDLDSYESRVRSAIKAPLAQHQFDALVSFDFNTGGILRAKLTQAINAGDPKASRHFFGWLRPPEIRGRREAEERLFRTGNYAANGDKITIWDALGDGRMKWRGTVTGAELAELMRAAGARRTVPATTGKAPARLSLWRFLANLWKGDRA
jgi:lysozyme